MLSSLVKKEFIQIGKEASTWEEAIITSAQPLLKAGKITESYIRGIIDSTNESGPYFVLLPHVALPHARPEKGAIEDAIGITILNQAVEFGNQSNDPVKYIFTLSATTNDKHLNALTELAKLLEDEEFFKILDSATSVDEIYKYLKNLE